jgi:hypothetical protein
MRKKSATAFSSDDGEETKNAPVTIAGFWADI